MNNVAINPSGMILSVSEAAERLGVTPGRVRQLVLDGRISATKFGRDLAIPESEVDRYRRERRPYRKS